MTGALTGGGGPGKLGQMGPKVIALRRLKALHCAASSRQYLARAGAAGVERIVRGYGSSRLGGTSHSYRRGSRLGWWLLVYPNFLYTNL